MVGLQRNHTTPAAVILLTTQGGNQVLRRTNRRGNPKAVPPSRPLLHPLQLGYIQEVFSKSTRRYCLEESSVCVGVGIVGIRPFGDGRRDERLHFHEKCGAKHAKDHNAKCVEGCVKGGAAAVFVTGGKVYKVDDASKVAEHLGHEVTITGAIDGDTVKVESVKM